MLSDLVYRVRSLFQRKDVEAEMNDELQFHFEQEVSKYEKAGLPREEAERRARLAFGGMDTAKEECREARGVSLVETTIQDLRYGLRQMRRSPGFTAVALTTLALGIGVNTAIFSVVDAVLLKPLIAPDPDRVVIFMNTNRQGSGPAAAEIEFNLWRKQTNVLEGVSGFGSTQYYLTGVSQPQKVEAMLVTEDYFRLFGLRIAQGRGFTPQEELGTDRLFENGHVAVLSNEFGESAFWRRP